MSFDSSIPVETDQINTPFEEPQAMANVYEPVSPERNQSLCDAIFESENNSPTIKRAQEKPALENRDSALRTILVTEHANDEELVNH